MKIQNSVLVHEKGLQKWLTEYKDTDRCPLKILQQELRKK